MLHARLPVTLTAPCTSFGCRGSRRSRVARPLPLRAEEGLRTDEEWGAIARDFVTAMGFDDNEGTKACADGLPSDTACRRPATITSTSP